MNTPPIPPQRSRTFEMKKPAGHVPAIQRYSSQVGGDVSKIRMVVLGFQEAADADDTPTLFLKYLETVFSQAGQPDHFDSANFDDDQGYKTSIAVCYWLDETGFSQWVEKFNEWWGSLNPKGLKQGLWIESFAVAPPYRETNVFKQYIRGLSACPMTKIEPMSETGYWGAARDRFEASAYDDFEPDQHGELLCDTARETFAKRIAVTELPDKMCVIRSGQTWEDCGEEQLASYEKNLKPKLDIGMSFLRGNPQDTGCCSLRQVTCLDTNGAAQKESYSLGIFLSFGHLERWAHNHPTHLAIYTRALAERQKYQENLELLTYHEIYILNEDVKFEYINCHPQTGLLPYFTNTVIHAPP